MQFLHSPAWKTFQQRMGHRPARHEGNIYTETVAGRFFHYGSGSRLVFDAASTLPDLPGRPHFLRLEPLDEASLAQLQRLAVGKPLAPSQAIQPRQSLLLDLGQSDEALLANMHSKHRYNIRVAARQEVTTELFSQFDEAVFKRFWHLLSVTAKRQGFRTHSEGYYREMWRTLAESGMAHILIARHGALDLATMLLITFEGTATYLHGASSDADRQRMAPYALHWQAMAFAKEQSCTFYDFWGTHAEKDNEGHYAPIPDHPSAGVTRLKLGFGGTIVEYPGAFDLVLNPFWYSAYRAIRSTRSQKRAFQ